MMAYPVHYHVDHPRELSPLQLLIRLVAFLALGVLGLSIGTLFVFVYLALPVIAAIRSSSQGGAAYVERDGPGVIGALHWLAALYAWAGLVADRLPSRSPSETVALTVDVASPPTPGSALLRVITGLPSTLVLWILGWIGVFVWLWAALSILVTRRIGPSAFGYLVGLQRWTLRLLVYQASLVDEYPPFSFAETPPVGQGQEPLAHPT
jgi:hypothetical protein